MTIEEKHEKLIKMLLCMLFGNFGLHHFYVCNNRAGFLRLTSTMCGLFSFGITTLIASIFSVKDFINIANDKDIPETKRNKGDMMIIIIFSILVGFSIAIPLINFQAKKEMKEVIQEMNRQNEQTINMFKYKI